MYMVDIRVPLLAGSVLYLPALSAECPLDGACPSDTRAAVPRGPQTMLPAQRRLT
jgi:hypothetical protein